MLTETFKLINDSKTNSNLRNLSLFFTQFCQARNEQVSQKLAQFIIKINLINFKHRSVLTDEGTTVERQNFLKMCCDNFFDSENVSCLTLRMQGLFHTRFLNREALRDHEKQSVSKKSRHLVQRLCTEDPKDLHNDLVRLILIREGMDDPSAYQEMKTAVQSVFPSSVLQTFVQSSRKTKMALIAEISSIAAGIRLHAWHSHKAGKFMLDVGKIMREILPQMNEDIFEELSTTNSDIEQLVEKLMKEEKDHEKRCLVFFTNYRKFMKQIKENVEEVAVQTYKLDYTFNVLLRELESALKTAPFSKADKVYPLYKEIARTWRNVQTEAHILSFYSNLYQELKALASQIQCVEPSKSEIELPDNIEPHSKDDGNARIIMPDEVKNFDNVTLKFQDLCSYYCSLGIVVPCKRNLGIVTWNDYCYGFSTVEAMQVFLKDPEECLNGVRRHILAMPELVATLNLPVIENTRSRVRPVMVRERGIQTFLHPTEKKIDSSYHWNQWSLRKRALHTVDVMDKKTHSTQTDMSHFRRENHSQVYLPKDQSTQTRKDNSTNLSRAEITELYAS